MMERCRINLQKATCRQKYLQLLLCGIYVCINVFLLYYHEPWRDEAQAWLIARDVPFLSIPGYMSYEGHPCLWHLIIACFAKLNMPYLTLNIVSLTIMTISVGLMVFYSKVSSYLKVLLIFSPVLTYYYPIIARSYCLIPLFLFFSAIFFKSRKEHPARYTLAIAFLIQTNVIMIFTAFLMCVCFLAEVVSDYIHKQKKMDLIKYGGALTLPLISVVLLGCQMLDIKNNSEFGIRISGIMDLPVAILLKVRNIIKDMCGINVFVLFVIAFLFFVLLTATCIYRRSMEKGTVFFVIIGTLIGQIVFYIVFYDFSVQRILVIPLLILWAVWILKESYNDKSIIILEMVFSVFILIVLLHHIPAIRADIEKPYSGSKEASIFIKENIPEDAILISDNKPECSAIMPYLKQKSYLYAANGEKSSYTKWINGWDADIEYDQFIAWVKQMDVGEKEVWLISSCNKSFIVGIEQICEDYELYYESANPSIQEEDYRIYRLR